MIGRGVALGAFGLLAVVLLVSARAPRALEAASVSVTSWADSGPGSFRKAIELANADPSINVIVLRNLLPVTLTSTVEYTGTQALTIQGDNPLLYRTVQGSLFVPGNPDVEPLDCGMFRSTGGADLTFNRVTFQHSWCDALNVTPVVGDDEIVITLDRVALRNNFGSGLFLHEIEEAEAAISLHVTASLVTGNGRCRGADGCAFGGIELQGVGQGAIDARIAASTFTGNGGDGLSVVWDEVEVTAATPPLAVDLTATVTDSILTANGGSVVSIFAAGEGGGREGPSIATHQAGNGLTVAGNGLGAGSMTVTLTGVHASGNAGDGIAVQEGVPDAGGDAGLEVNATSVLAWGNGDDGLDLSEFAGGLLAATLTSVSTWSNDDNGVEALESGDGHFTFQVTGSSSYGNGSEGFDVEQEDGAGDLTADFDRVTVTANGGDGINGGDDGAGGLAFSLVGCTIVLNGEDAVDLAAQDAPGTFARGGSVIVGNVELQNVVEIP